MNEKIADVQWAIATEALATEAPDNVFLVTQN